LSSPSGGGAFSTWDRRGDVTVELEQWAPASWDEGLRSRGHRIVRHHDTESGLFGHAHVIRVVGDALEGAADPRALGGAAAGY
jgi:gamma-glutamyltranspeptidase / glutathione hydrolase